jgi:Aldo/keto reductase family/SPFH domain / Band 7 family
VLWFRVSDPQKTVLTVENFRSAVQQVALTSLLNVIGQHDLDEVLKERDKINALLKRNVLENTSAWGVAVELLEMKDVLITVGHFGNEREVGRALQAGLAAGGIAREDIFVTTKLWNNNHRSERVEPAFEASLDRLGLKYLDLYLIHTPFAFQPGTSRIRGIKTAMSFTTTT